MVTPNTKKPRTRHRNRRSVPVRTSIGRSRRSLAVLMIILGGLAGITGGLVPDRHSGVLAYATNVSHNGLLLSTNKQRDDDRLAPLALNTRLNAAAQAKANDMVAKNYWSHTSPDGREPWDFIVKASYSYDTAGENLAYGALTSQETVAAWMNSPGHRANILNARFSQVGFGFANSTNYRGTGPQTVIVAMYASPHTALPVAATASTAPLGKDAQQVPVLASASQQSQTIRRVALLTSLYAPWVIAVAAIAGLGAVAVSAYRHSKAWHRWAKRGEYVMLRHPVVDAFAVFAIVVTVVLMQSAGQIL